MGALRWRDWGGSVLVHGLLLAAGLLWASYAHHAPQPWQALDLPMQWAAPPPAAPQALVQADAPQAPQADVRKVAPKLAPAPKINAAHTQAPAQPPRPADALIPPAAAAPLPSAAANTKPEALAQSAPMHPSAAATDWRSVLGSMLHKHKRYPAIARRLQQQGTVTLMAAFSAQGDLLDCQVLSSSGADSLDDAALQLVRQAAIAASRQLQPGKTLQMRIPINYSLLES